MDMIIKIYMCSVLRTAIQRKWNDRMSSERKFEARHEWNEHERKNGNGNGNGNATL